jgi:5-methylcytosine-specific restriction endonuclease McrA
MAMNNKEILRKIYQKTDGYCHLCHKKLSFNNYGQHGTKGGWHKEHSLAKANGGTDHLNNLLPACISCNFSKGIKSTKKVRRKNGVNRAPFSKIKKEKIKTTNTLATAAGGALIGSYFGPGGIIIGGLIGGIFGNNNSAKR